jgi:hypothetical protein
MIAIDGLAAIQAKIDAAGGALQDAERALEARRAAFAEVIREMELCRHARNIQIGKFADFKYTRRGR